jgi:RHS repeat-associated protein
MVQPPLPPDTQPEDVEEILAERTVYGEDLGSAAATNHRGRVYQHFDGAGVVTSVRYDFKGNLIEGERRLAKEYRAHVDWLAIKDLMIPDLSASPANDLLEGESFGTTTAYDALNRPTSLITQHDQSEILPTYNEASLLERVEVRIRGAQDKTTFVDNIDYNAKGQRKRIVYGGVLDQNGVLGKRTTTVYKYDRLTFRLAHLKTKRERDGELLQSLHYTYDPVGNITGIRDGAQQNVFFANDVVTPSTAYVYDAIYRLIEATGREHAGGLADVQRDDSNLPLVNLPHVNDMQAVRNYTETYEYDKVGNILRMVHAAGNQMSNPGSWTRRYAYELHPDDKNKPIDEQRPISNRLMGTSVPTDGPNEFSAPYTYDAHGNMISMPHLPDIGWDYRDQMMRANLLGTGGTVYFTYDAAGQRVRKVWEHNGLVEERIYLGGWEIYRKRQQQGQTRELVLERETLHVMDGERRIALVETKTIDASVPAFQTSTVIRFQMGNHLGSAVLEVDETGQLISYEEYHPYGTTAYSAGTGGTEVSLKRYRYTGKERDEETGLYYHGARYYAPWLGRWTSADPAGFVDGANLYAYVKGSPICLHDPTGTETKPRYLGRDELPHFQKVLGGKHYYDKTGPDGPGYYVRIEGNRILPAPVPKTQDPDELPSGPGMEFLHWDPSKAQQAETPSEEAPSHPRPTREQLEEKVPLLPFFIKDYAGGYGWNQYVRQQDVPPGAPVGLAELRQLTGARGGLPVAQFSRNYAPGTSIENLTLETVSAIASVVGHLSVIGKATALRPRLSGAEAAIKGADEAATRWGAAMSKIRDALPNAECDRLSRALIRELGEGELVTLFPKGGGPLPTIPGVAPVSWAQHTAVRLANGTVLDPLKNKVHPSLTAFQSAITGEADVGIMINGVIQ